MKVIYIATSNYYLLLLLLLFSFVITSPLRGEKNVLTSESYPLSEISRTLLKMKAVPSNAAFCKQLITMGIPMVVRWFWNFSVTVPKAPTTIGITVALTFHNFCNCNLKCWYLVVFSSSFTLMFWSPGTAMSMILHSLFSLSMTTIKGFSFSFQLICFQPLPPPLIFDPLSFSRELTM